MQLMTDNLEHPIWDCPVIFSWGVTASCSRANHTKWVLRWKKQQNKYLWNEIEPTRNPANWLIHHSLFIAASDYSNSHRFFPYLQAWKFLLVAFEIKLLGPQQPYNNNK